jgi:hypothetical protein
VAENQPANKHRMNNELSNFAARLRERFFVGDDVRSLHSIGETKNEPSHVGSYEINFNSLALELFALQFENNFTYQKICEIRKLTPQNIEHWTQIPGVPTSAFKELELTSIEPKNRTAVFHSSGTTEQKPSRHFHCAESLAVYEVLLWKWFEQNVLTDLRFEDSAKFPIRRGGVSAERRKSDEIEKCAFSPKAATTVSSVISLAPPSKLAPRSSLVHMFETVCQKLGAPETAFVGKISNEGAWTLDFDAALDNLQSAICNPRLILGTAFSFVHLLDFLAERNLKFQLPEGSRVMETGGYKNRSRNLPKVKLHSLITEFLGVPRENIICEYGMSELSSQAYSIQNSKFKIQNCERGFQFPLWARAQIISPETGREVADGETGLIRIFDLANVFSVAAIQTEDLGIRRGENFELIGRAQLAEPRGCSLTSA